MCRKTRLIRVILLAHALAGYARILDCFMTQSTRLIAPPSRNGHHVSTERCRRTMMPPLGIVSPTFFNSTGSATGTEQAHTHSMLRTMLPCSRSCAQRVRKTTPVARVTLRPSSKPTSPRVLGEKLSAVNLRVREQLCTCAPIATQST